MLSWLQDADIGILSFRPRVTERSEDVEVLQAQRAKPRKPRVRYDLIFTHAGVDGNVEIDPTLESLGTRRFIQLTPVFDDLLHGGTWQAYFVDEIGASLHSELLLAFLQRFNCQPEQHRVRGQLVFSTHETRLIEAEAKNAVLRRDQIYFTEKDAQGASTLFSVAEFRERNNLNVRRRYLQGRYGALPSLGDFGDE